jgi:hypothetical protein
MEETNHQASSSVKVVKFTTGEEVVAIVQEKENEVVLTDPAKIVVYSTSNEEGHVVECVRLTSYLGNVQDKQITILKQYIMYISSPVEDIQRMYDAYIKFMNGTSDEIMAAEIEEPDTMELAWNMFSDPEFVEFLQDMFDDHLAENAELDEEEVEELEREWEKEIEPKKAKKRKSKIEELRLPYNPEEEASDPRSWSDNPEDYLK